MAADERENKSVSKAKPEEAPKAVKPEAEEHKEASPDEPEKKDEEKKEGDNGVKKAESGQEDTKAAEAQPSGSSQVRSVQAAPAAKGSGYVTKADVDPDSEKSGDKKKKKKKKNPMDPKELAKKAAMGQAASLSMKAAMMMAMKSMLKMVMQLVTQVAHTITSGIAAIFTMIGQAIGAVAGLLGVSVAVATGGAAVVVAAVVIAVVAVAVNAVTDVASRDDTHPCEEEVVWEFGSGNVSGDMDESARKLYSFFTQLGYTKTNIAGVFGNWEVESGLDPTAVETIFDEPFLDLSDPNNSNTYKYKTYRGSHEACKCEWLRTFVTNDSSYQTITKIEDTDGLTHGDMYEFTDTDGTVSTWEYCWECSEGSEHECEHGYTREHTYTGSDGIEHTCTDGWTDPCSHGFTEPHHVAVYHNIDFRMRCMDKNLEDDQSEGFDRWSSSSWYDHPYCGIGLGQWTDSRNRDLLAYARSKNLEWYLAEVQLAFMIDTENGDGIWAQWFRNWKEEDNPSDAAIVFAREYEGNTAVAQTERTVKATEWYLRFAEYDVDVDYAQSIIDLAGATADIATNLAAGRTMDSCSTILRADNSSIATAAMSFAWENEDMSHNDGTALWQCVKDATLGEADGEGSNWQYKSCDRTVAAAVRWSGADNEYPAGDTTVQYRYLSSNTDQWARVYWQTEQDLLPGDVLIFTSQMNGSEHGHTLIYVGDGKIVEGSYSSDSPHIDDFKSSYHRPAKFDVFRCVKKESNPEYTDISCGGVG